jgi:hypothetical protein
MPEQSKSQTTIQEHEPEDHRPAGENPLNVPLRHLDASPPQPNTPHQGEQPAKQDHQPLQPDPLLHKVEERRGKQRELRNG